MEQHRFLTEQVFYEQHLDFLITQKALDILQEESCTCKNRGIVRLMHSHKLLYRLVSISNPSTRLRFNTTNVNP